ncbi:cell division protein FtsQ/DivIB [Longivirga aurantiaca]|uniref:Cell division protein FtsQ n=1 Tax=Longivirga aurantiaca TaxID=1837743 RepID=A0ABW1T1X3_9ACTN
MTVLESTERFTAARRQGGWRTWLALALVAMIAGVAVWLVWFSSVLSVQEVRVVGATGVPVDQVRTAASVRVGTPLARVDADGVAERVGAIPEVGAVEVRRGWPDVLVVVVTERTPVGVVRAGPGFAYVDATGARFGSASTRPAALPVVRPSDETSLLAGVQVVDSLPADLRARVVAVVARSRDDVVLSLRGGALVQWGSAEQAEAKIAVLAALLPLKAAYYDVSAPDLPTTRGTLSGS